MAKKAFRAESPTGDIPIADSPEGGLIGTIGLVPEQWWWSDCWFLQQMWVYVMPRFRAGGAVGEALFRWAADRRVEIEEKMPPEARPFLTGMDHFYGDRIEARDRYWRRWGTQGGSIFVAGLPDPPGPPR